MRGVPTIPVEISIFDGKHDWLVDGLLAVVPQLFASVHVLVCVPPEHIDHEPQDHDSVHVHELQFVHVWVDEHADLSVPSHSSVPSFMLLPQVCVEPGIVVDVHELQFVHVWVDEHADLSVPSHSSVPSFMLLPQVCVEPGIVVDVHTFSKAGAGQLLGHEHFLPTFVFPTHDCQGSHIMS